MNLEQYHDKLLANGWKELPNGACSYAVLRRDHRVIKIADDTAWLAYILWARRSTIRRKFAPKVYSVIWPFKNSDDDYDQAHFVARMEYIPLPYDKRPRFSDWLDDVVYEYNNPKVSLKKLNKRYPGFAKFWSDLSDNFWLDMHEGNYGYRRNGSLCIFDPTTGCHNKLDNDLLDSKPRIRKLGYR